MIFSTATLLGVASTAVLASPVAPDSSFNWKNTEYVLTFGDSYTFVQGTEGRWAYSFIGSQLNISFTPEQLLGDRIVPGQNTSSAGGPNWVQELTGCKEGHPRDCDRQLWGFAYAGADISTTFVPLHWNHTISYEKQIEQWDTWGKPVIDADAGKTLVASWIGINDINDMASFKLPFNGLSTWEELYTAVVAEQFAALETVYEAGYRHFLFLNLPPLDKNPASQLNPARLPNTSMIKTYNEAVNQTARAFSEKHPGATALVFDTYGWLTRVFDDAAAYGITNTTSFCPQYKAWDIETNYAAYGCQPIGEYFWYNSGHITYTAHRALAGKVDEFLAEKSVGRCGGRNRTESAWGTRWIGGEST
ncbi:Putative GDSL lipase/esterase, SGNH hydrolase superfamily [Colletotrichum destructivum]|uniref:GDSL lipase/esterase, SGNH hydrolase superfamily n=1 Tax=Colletotrichum destructivum TaxID=34406 RepID=A0AAX4I394_9PEZI|nr:Putative GDSL lipase/esterase, SGNH hydrolase superfamily [Colletotrichum destructivum]